MSDGKYIYTEKEVRMMWQRSKPEQIQVAQAKCLEAIVRTGGQLAVSFSGGKDSAVLLYLMAQMWSVSSYKDKPLRVFFSNTTNEFSCATKYRKEYLQFIKEKRSRGMAAGMKILENCKYILIGDKYGISDGMKAEMTLAALKGKVMLYEQDGKIYLVDSREETTGGQDNE